MPPFIGVAAQGNSAHRPRPSYVDQKRPRQSCKRISRSPPIRHKAAERGSASSATRTEIGRPICPSTWAEHIAAAVVCQRPCGRAPGPAGAVTLAGGSSRPAPKPRLGARHLRLKTPSAQCSMRWARAGVNDGPGMGAARRAGRGTSEIAACAGRLLPSPLPASGFV